MKFQLGFIQKTSYLRICLLCFFFFKTCEKSLWVVFLVEIPSEIHPDVFSYFFLRFIQKISQRFLQKCFFEFFRKYLKILQNVFHGLFPKFSQDLFRNCFMNSKILPASFRKCFTNCLRKFFENLTQKNLSLIVSEVPA